LPKYYYKPLEETVAGTRLETSFATGSYDNSVIIVVDAPTQELAHELGKSILNLQVWELDHVEE
jgi:hypothetical protein